MDVQDELAHRIEDPDSIAGADLVVGIPSFREADSIGYVVAQVAQGLRRYPGRRVAIVNMDNASDDDTEAAFFAAPAAGVPRLYITTPPGVAGKGNNIYNLLTQVCEWRPEAVAVVDADLRSITPEWVSRLLDPILGGYDFVTPRYTRHPHDGTITNHLCYPLLYGLCQVDLRQPIGGDFAFSSWMAQRWLQRPWPRASRQYGVDISMTVQAVFEGGRIGEVGLGAKIHKPSAPKLGPMFLQVVSSLFGLLVENRFLWCNGNPRVVADRLGGDDSGQPPELRLEADEILAKAQAELQRQAPTLAQVLPRNLVRAVSDAIRNGTRGIDVDAWSECVCEALLAYAAGAGEAAVACLRPLYFGRVARFVADTDGLAASTCEAMIRDQAEVFRQARAHVVEGLSERVAA